MKKFLCKIWEAAQLACMYMLVATMAAVLIGSPIFIVVSIAKRSGTGYAALAAVGIAVFIIGLKKLQDWSKE